MPRQFPWWMMILVSVVMFIAGANAYRGWTEQNSKTQVVYLNPGECARIQR